MVESLWGRKQQSLNNNKKFEIHSLPLLSQMHFSDLSVPAVKEKLKSKQQGSSSKILDVLPRQDL